MTAYIIQRGLRLGVKISYDAAYKMSKGEAAIAYMSTGNTLDLDRQILALERCYNA